MMRTAFYSLWILCAALLPIVGKADVFAADRTNGHFDISAHLPPELATNVLLWLPFCGPSTVANGDVGDCGPNRLGVAPTNSSLTPIWTNGAANFQGTKWVKTFGLFTNQIGGFSFWAKGTSTITTTYSGASVSDNQLFFVLGNATGLLTGETATWGINGTNIRGAITNQLTGWNHISFQFRTTNYVGELNGATTANIFSLAATNAAAGTNTLFVGCFRDISGICTATLDDIILWKVGLTRAQSGLLYTNTVNGRR